MVRIASDAFESAMEPPMDADHLIDEVAGSTNPWQGDRYADLALLLPQILIVLLAVNKNNSLPI